MASPEIIIPNSRNKLKKHTLQYPAEALDKFVLLKFAEYNRDSPSTRPTSTITTTISMPMPYNISEQNNIRINSDDFGLFGFLGSQQELKELPSDGFDALVKSMGESTTFDMIKGALALTPGMSDTMIARQAGRSLGLIRNPHTAAFFEGVSLRPWNFSWKVSPRSKDESDALKKITDKIKERIYPETDDIQYSLKYPDQIFVEFKGVSDYIEAPRKAFVSGFIVNYASSAGLAWYNSGAPVEVEITLIMTEVDILTRNELRGDYK